jgi:glycosyltransferase involved in cell wall biosynthesis
LTGATAVEVTGALGPTRRDRVGFFLPTLDGGGAERALLTLAAQLRATGDDAVLIVGNASGALRDQLPTRLPVMDLDRARIRSTLPALVGALRALRPRCVISTLDHANILSIAAARLAGTGTTPIVRVANTQSQAMAGATVREQLVMRAVRFVYPFAGAVVAPAHHVADDLVTFARVRRTKIHVIPNPVVDDDLRTRAAMPADHPWFQPGQPPVVLGVGRLVHQKRFDLLVDAFNHVRSRHDARLLILGYGPDRDPLLRRARAHGLGDDVSLPGFDPNPLRFMARAGVVASTSRYEGLPAVLIQALACDAKVVATDCPGGSAEVLGHGAYGNLVRSTDPQVFGDALLSALRADPTTNDRASWDRYTVDTAVQGYRTLIAAVTDPDVPATR